MAQSICVRSGKCDGCSQKLRKAPVMKCPTCGWYLCSDCTPIIKDGPPPPSANAGAEPEPKSSTAAAAAVPTDATAAAVVAAPPAEEGGDEDGEMVEETPKIVKVAPRT